MSTGRGRAMDLLGHIQVGHRQARVRLYDFRRPDKFSKEQTRTLELIHENFARFLTTTWSGHLRTMVQVFLEDIRQMTFGEYLAPLSDPAIMAVFNMSPLEGTAIMDMDPQVAFTMIDRLFGGPGHALDERRPLTELEQGVIQRMLTTSLQGLREAWAQVATIQPKLLSMESNPLFLQVVPLNDVVIMIRFATKLGEHRGHFQLCLPYLLLEPILPKLSAHQWFARERQRARPVGMEQQLRQVDVDVWVELGRSGLTLKDLMELEVGDVVPLTPRAPNTVTVYIEDQPCLLGRAGRVGDRLAVNIIGPVDEREVLSGE